MLIDKADLIIFRDIRPYDELPLLSLRNNPLNLKYFKNPNAVDSQDHAHWFKARITEYKGMQIVAEVSTRLVGIAYLTPINDESVAVSININPEFQSKGIGKELLSQIIACAEILGISQLDATIQESNIKSISLFQSYGFCFFRLIPNGFTLYIKTII